MVGANRTLLVHFSSGASGDSLPWEGGGPASSAGTGTSLLTWYCQWAKEFAASVLVLVPERLKHKSGAVASALGGAKPLWYSEEGLSGLPSHGRRDQVWVVNGNQLPMVNWTAARSAVRRHRSEIMVFGQAGIDVGQHYEESVLVGTTGEVMGFKRHYSDSPAFLDLRGDEASFLVAPGEHAPTVVNHVVARGWGLDSIGAMTRRFSVRWAPTRCVLAEVATRATADAAPHATPRPEAEPPDRSSDLRSKAPNPQRSLNEVPRGKDGRRNAKNPYGRNGAGVDDHRDTSDPGPAGQRTRSAAHASPVARTLEGDHGRTKRPAVPTAAQLEVEDDERTKHRYLFWKRVIDVTVSAIGLIVLSPLLAAVALLIKCTSPGPVFFAHKRQGAGGKEFPCLKFRSMRTGADALQETLRKHNEVDGPQFKIEHDPRLTPLGPWLRQSNIDELPQLINVLLGQMSLVGPRPSPDKENQLCPAWRRARLSVKPGVTGLWQVLRLRDDEQSDFQEWIYYDVEYARHQSLWLDFQLLLYTPISMFMPGHLRRFAERLRRRGVCKHSARLAREITVAA